MKKLPILLFVLVASAGLRDSALAGSRLNLLYITADDMNADSPGWMGGRMGATPELDQLAATSHRFLNNHVTAPICQPSREAMFTKWGPHRSGALGFNPVQPGTPTLVTALQAAGYYAAAINKTPHMKPDAEFPWNDKNAWPDGTAKFKVEAMSGISYKAIAAAGEKDERIAARVKQLRVGEPLMFFNEQTDSGERSNSIADANYAAEIKRLAALLLEQMEKTGDPQTENFQQAMADWQATAGKLGR